MSGNSFKISLSLFSLDEKFQPKDAPELITSFYVEDFPLKADDFQKQRFIKGVLYNKFQEVLSVYFDCKVFSPDGLLLYHYKDFFALDKDRRMILGE